MKNQESVLQDYPQGEQPRFNSQLCIQEDNMEGISQLCNGGQLYGIVDESKGGFIGYAIGEEHAEIIAKALNEKLGTAWKI